MKWRGAQRVPDPSGGCTHAPHVPWLQREQTLFGTQNVQAPTLILPLTVVKELRGFTVAFTFSL
jgi:hypothetical protein